MYTSAGSSKKQENSRKTIYFCFIDYAKAFDCVDHNKLWKILQEMRIPDHLPCLLRNLCAGQEATVRTGHRTTDWLQIGKRVREGCILSPCLFNLYAEYIMRNYYLSSQGYGFSCGHVWMWELDCEEGWVPRNWCFWTVVLQKTLESLFDCKEIHPTSPS